MVKRAGATAPTALPVRLRAAGERAVAVSVRGGAYCLVAAPSAPVLPPLLSMELSP
jgi:hypothetical protein